MKSRSLGIGKWPWPTSLLLVIMTLELPLHKIYSYHVLMGLRLRKWPWPIFFSLVFLVVFSYTLGQCPLYLHIFLQQVTEIKKMTLTYLYNKYYVAVFNQDNGMSIVFIDVLVYFSMWLEVRTEVTRMVDLRRPGFHHRKVLYWMVPFYTLLTLTTILLEK
jgi:hypothetical protein